jgi:hypothetical protein
MDLYSGSLLLGSAGLAIMAVGGLAAHHGGAAHSHSNDAGDGGLGIAHHHGGPATGHASPLALGGRGGAARVAGARSGHGRGPGAFGGRTASQRVVELLSPRVFFSLAVGFGAAGMIARHSVGGPVLWSLAILGGVAFEYLAVAPLWNVLSRFASEPALTLESVLFDEAKAVTGFDARGQGLIAVELDGQVVQLLGTLSVQDIAAGAKVRAGDSVRVDAVDSARNRCTVSVVRG